MGHRNKNKSFWEKKIGDSLNNHDINKDFVDRTQYTNYNRKKNNELEFNSKHFC